MELVLAAALALGIVFFLAKARLNYLRLPELPAGSGRLRPDVTVIIPARNEERNIQRAVRSFAGCRVVVVDDDSEDRTAELASAAGAEVMRAPPLQPGTLGKPNACAAGARRAGSEWLLFVDADTWFAPGFPASVVEYARAEAVDVLTCFLASVRVSWAERLLLPYAFALYFAGVSAARVNSKDSPEALANGQCILFRRMAYEALGGHAAVRSSVIEDVALASLAKQHRLRVRVVRAERLGCVRMYHDLASIWRGFGKNSFRFLKQNPWTGVQVIAASVLLTSYLPMIVWLLARGNWPGAVVFAFVPSLSLWPWFAGTSAAAAPVAIYLFQLIALDGMFRTVFGRIALWKGRRV